MTTPTHIASNLVVFLTLIHVQNLNQNYLDLCLIIGSNLVDLDHLFSSPIYHPKRNPFKTHFLHKQWKVISFLSILMLFYRPLIFLGIGLILHFFLDYLYIKREKV
ncbi:MAG: hypothetical protein US18_C0017G0020 [Parcubacteria group bacterium GW2011_GWB1_36_5]|nr:MAG: hypothetical protein US12_C0020G0001 [Parcubacteria group bacterium GW2011_GWA2_36_24]KKQ07425.1 MAG: hypothetical protein US18_C0017G0020 [Parcubacteria group bacterium GW2011_GWB1_36_5]